MEGDGGDARKSSLFPIFVRLACNSPAGRYQLYPVLKTWLTKVRARWKTDFHVTRSRREHRGVSF